MPPRRSKALFFATGIEDTFITAPHPRTGRTLDEYELTQHYTKWRSDLDRMASLGVTRARYGVPWHRIQPSPRRWDWSFADRTLNRLLELNIEPIVDLVHYGLPTWIDGAYMHPDFPELMADYAARLAERFRGPITMYTPLNEPRITAWYCGKLGWWPPNLRGWGGFVRVMLACCRGIVRTIEALRAVDRRVVPVHVDATDLYESHDPSLREELRRRQQLVFLALDLISGRVTSRHPLLEWLLARGASVPRLDWFHEHAVDLPLIGLNLYPMFSRKVLARTSTGLRTRMPYADATIIERLAAMYWRRYRAPMFIAETASVGSVARRMRWLHDSVDAVHRARARGIPLVGYTWWPMYGLVTWGYREGRLEPAKYLRQMGLWDLRADGNGNLHRVGTPLFGEYHTLATQAVSSRAYSRGISGVERRSSARDPSPRVRSE